MPKIRKPPPAGILLGGPVDERVRARLLFSQPAPPISDAKLDLGLPDEIRDLFIGFQKYLYQPTA